VGDGIVSERVVNDLRYEVLVKLQSLSLDYFNRSKMGDLLMRIDGDTMALNRCIGSGFMDIVKEPFTMIGIVIALWRSMRSSRSGRWCNAVCLLPVSYFGKRARGQLHHGAQTSRSRLLWSC
jgi:ABC-type multidrug transport system fused ATPase/permease subunit